MKLMIVGEEDGFKLALIRDGVDNGVDDDGCSGCKEGLSISSSVEPISGGGFVVMV